MYISVKENATELKNYKAEVKHIFAGENKFLVWFW